MIAIVVSTADSASEHVGDHLRDLADWEERTDTDLADAEGGGTYYRTAEFELRTFADLHLELESVADRFTDPDLLVFASRHAGDTGPLLTAHFTGNLGPAEYGGEAGELARACPNAQKAVVAALESHAPENYEVGIECTHHGPSSVGVPAMFVELGSGQEQWEDPEAARAVAAAILDLAGVDPDRERHLVGIGGGHYAPRFERVVRETSWAVGHVAADWALESVADPDDLPDVVDELFAQSRATRALVDGDHPDVEAVVEDLGHRVVSETWVREADDVDLSLLERLEADLGTVESGLRVGARTDVSGYVLATVPEGLLAEARGIDADATREAVAGVSVAFQTEEHGTQAGGRVALPDGASESARVSLVDSLATILEEKYDEVREEAGTLVARRSTFDPEQARAAGVSEGPAFGRLAAGEAVEADGRTVTPAEVTVEETVRFDLGEFGA